MPSQPTERWNSSGRLPATRSLTGVCLYPQRRVLHRRRRPAQRLPAPGVRADSAGTDPTEALTHRGYRVGPNEASAWPTSAPRRAPPSCWPTPTCHHHEPPRRRPETTLRARVPRRSPRGDAELRSRRAASEAGGRVGVGPGLLRRPPSSESHGGAHSSSRLAPATPTQSFH
jgi:hypothetical protein